MLAGFRSCCGAYMGGSDVGCALGDGLSDALLREKERFRGFGGGSICSSRRWSVGCGARFSLPKLVKSTAIGPRGRSDSAGSGTGGLCACSESLLEGC